MDLMRKKFYSMLAGGTLSSIIVSLMLVTDVVVAGFLIGDDAVAGMNLVVPAYSLAAAAATLLSIGTPILYAEAAGNFEREKADGIFRTGLTTAWGCGIVMFLAFLAAGDLYLSSFHVAPEILESAKTYMFWIRITLIFLPASIFLPGMILADGDELFSTLSDVVGSGSNIVLSVVLGRRMGVAGIGIGSLIGSVISISVCMLHFLKKRNSLRPGVCFSGRLIGSISRYGIVDASSYLFLAAFTSQMNRFLSIRFGSDMLILSSVLTLVIEMQFLLDGIGEAMTPVMSVYLTAGSREGIEKIWKEAKRSAVALGLICTAALAVLAPFVPEILGIEDGAIAQMAVNGARILSLSMPFVALLYLLNSYSVLTKRIAFGVVTTGLYEFIIAAPLAILLGFAAGIYGVFAGVVLASAATWFLIRCYVERKEGKAAWPLRLDEKGRKSFLFDFVTEPESIMHVQAEIERILNSNGIPPAAVQRCLFLFEEVYMEVYDKNGQKAVDGECILSLGDDSIRLFEIDDGIIFEMGEEVEESNSLREYVLSQALTKWSESTEYLSAISFNRNRLEIGLEKENEKMTEER